MSKKVTEVLGASMEKVRDMIDANTVVGTPITAADGTTLIPISKISFALASGGADLASKTAGLDGTFGGGAGCGVKITPMAFVVLQGEHVRVLPIAEPASNAAERLIEQIPDLLNWVKELVEGRKEEISEI